jgi:hypothetical protein
LGVSGSISSSEDGRLDAESGDLFEKISFSSSKSESSPSVSGSTPGRSSTSVSLYSTSKPQRRDIESISNSLDYRLLPITERPVIENQVRINGLPNRVLKPHNVIRRLPKASTSVWVITSGSGPLKGTLLPSPRFVKMAYWPTFEEVWVVELLDRPSCKSPNFLNSSV